MSEKTPSSVDTPWRGLGCLVVVLALLAGPPLLKSVDVIYSAGHMIEPPRESRRPF